MTVFIITTHLLTSSLGAQTVTNVTAEQQGNTVLIHYNLTTDTPCEVSLFISMNGGKSWTGPLLQASGDIGKNISSGSLTIRWEVLKEIEQLVGSNILFKVLAISKKSYEPEMVLVNGGTFFMGNNSGHEDEYPEHQVTLSDFFIGKYEVTQAQWRAVMGTNPSNFSGCDNCPVEMISWEDVQEFIKKLNTKTGATYRLPTEAEWEYAARGGQRSMGYSYSGDDDIWAVAWYSGNGDSKTHPIGQKNANELGIYDMSGNVFEWCGDWYGSYTATHMVNPLGTPSGQYRVSRGGSLTNNPQGCHAANRHSNLPNFRSRDLGFRLVLVAPY